MDINPSVKPLIDAINQVLAGGTATVQITQPGDPTKYRQLTTQLQNGIDEANKINGAAGYYVTISA
jgi:hypothetical protein